MPGTMQYQGGQNPDKPHLFSYSIEGRSLCSGITSPIFYILINSFTNGQTYLKSTLNLSKFIICEFEKPVGLTIPACIKIRQGGKGHFVYRHIIQLFCRHPLHFVSYRCLITDRDRPFFFYFNDFNPFFYLLRQELPGFKPGM